LIFVTSPLTPLRPVPLKTVERLSRPERGVKEREGALPPLLDTPLFQPRNLLSYIVALVGEGFNLKGQGWGENFRPEPVKKNPSSLLTVR
jgi:hypothetical protein